MFHFPLLRDNLINFDTHKTLLMPFLTHTALQTETTRTMKSEETI